MEPPALGLSLERRGSSLALGPDKRQDSIGSAPAHRRMRRALRSTAGSLSIEALGRSRWRLRRTRGTRYVF